MNHCDYPDIAAGRPTWLITLADLALLLVGFFVLVQAQHIDRQTLAKGFREGFGGHEAVAPAMPVAAAGMTSFAPGSAGLPVSGDGLIAWAREAARDPRVMLTVTGLVDGSPGDADPATGSGAVLAADRARAVAVLLAGAHAVAPGRMTITTAARPGNRAAMVTLSFAGDPR